MRLHDRRSCLSTGSGNLPASSAGRVFRVTGRFVRVVILATLGVALLYLVGWLYSLSGSICCFWTSPSSVGIAISGAICVLAALNLTLDFAFIERGVEAQVPAAMAWLGAFGLLTTLVWLYLEILRFLALLRGGSR